MTGLSYSNYSLLRQCGQRYKLRVIDKLPEPKQVNFEFGSAMHAGLNTALETHDVNQAQDVFESFWECSQKGLDFSGERFNKEAHTQMGNKFLATFCKKYAPDMKIITAEKRM